MNNLAARREQTIERLKRRNRITEAEAENVRNGLIAAPGLDGLEKADLITEAVSESGKTKKIVYRTLRDSGFAGILTTNTSSLTRASLVGDGDYMSEQFATTHFFNPVLHTQMVEVVRGAMNDTSYAALMTFLADIGRKPMERPNASSKPSLASGPMPDPMTHLTIVLPSFLTTFMTITSTAPTPL